MSLQKVSKEEWLKLSHEERDYLALQFNKSVEKRKRIVLTITRGIAVFCVFALLFIGYAQIEATRSYGQIKEKYGNDAYCYLCGLENLKKCECQYTTTMDYGNQRLEKPSLTAVGLNLAEYNVQGCLSYEAWIEQQGKDMGLNFTLTRPAIAPKISGIPLNISITP